MKQRCCDAPDHELVAVFKGEGSKALERQIENCEPCMLRMEGLSPVSGLLREAVTEEVGEVEALGRKLESKLDSKARNLPRGWIRSLSGSIFNLVVDDAWLSLWVER